MSVSRIVIAIDGPAASGKSSTAQSVADRLHIRHVDSGSLYRALTMVALEASPDAAAWAEADVLGQSSRVTLVPADSRSFAPLVDGQPVGDRVRSAEVTGHVSLVASMGRVRAWVNEQIRAAARAHDVVVDGRDIGTAVFPQAMLKVFLVADPQERARRRLMQRLNRGPTDAEVAEETDRLVRRDARDAVQTVPARDAVVLDTTSLTQAEQVERIVALARAVTHREDVTSGG
ncbi:MAG TPA: (d)CMP kinase [Gemmatimonadaceae bacterium]